MVRKGYTLVELLIVIGITVLLLSLAIGGMSNSQKSFTFSNAYERVIQLVREARSSAVTGKATLDYNDYDNDGKKAIDNDYVTPAAYGIDFYKGTATVPGTVTLFADLHKSTPDPNQREGTYDPPVPFALNKYQAGKDLAIAQFTLPKPLKLILKGTLPPSLGPVRQQIFFTPIFADVTIQPALTNKLFIFGVSEGTAKGRFRCSQIHPIAGVPEVASNAASAAASNPVPPAPPGCFYI